MTRIARASIDAIAITLFIAGLMAAAIAVGA
ncbi:hypothetical protein HNR47_000600 [Methylopila jiangsuensis]|nr:hypothetical protein [Methylopila jiangsuensis]